MSGSHRAHGYRSIAARDVNVESDSQIQAPPGCHPDMKGSWSIKAVLPTIAPDLDYSTVGEIQEGGAAFEAFLELLDRPLALARRADLRKDLLDYCKLDALALVRLTSALAGTSHDA